jgi:hypothetical protein
MRVLPPQEPTAVASPDHWTPEKSLKERGRYASSFGARTLRTQESGCAHKPQVIFFPRRSISSKYWRADQRDALCYRCSPRPDSGGAQLFPLAERSHRTRFAACRFWLLMGVAAEARRAHLREPSAQLPGVCGMVVVPNMSDSRDLSAPADVLLLPTSVRRNSKYGNGVAIPAFATFRLASAWPSRRDRDIPWSVVRGCRKSYGRLDVRTFACDQRNCVRARDFLALRYGAHLLSPFLFVTAAICPGMPLHRWGKVPFPQNRKDGVPRWRPAWHRPYRDRGGKHFGLRQRPPCCRS